MLRTMTRSPMRPRSTSLRTATMRPQQSAPLATFEACAHHSSVKLVSAELNVRLGENYRRGGTQNGAPLRPVCKLIGGERLKNTRGQPRPSRPRKDRMPLSLSRCSKCVFPSSSAPRRCTLPDHEGQVAHQAVPHSRSGCLSGFVSKDLANATNAQRGIGLFSSQAGQR